MNTRAPASHQQGIAAITALLVVALATILAAELAWELHVDIRRTETNLLRAQAIQLGIAAEYLAADQLEQDYEDDGKNNQHCDGPDDTWAQDVTFPIEGTQGTLRGKISDLQGRFNLNNLLKGGKKDPEAFEYFERLLQLLELDPALAAKVLDWIDPDQVAEFNGAEDGIYTARDPAYRTANTWLTTTRELLAIDGFIDPDDPSIELVEQLERYVTALPGPQKINVNFAPDAVLAAMAENPTTSTADDLRENGPYCDILTSGNAGDIAFMDDAKDIVDPDFANTYLEVGSNFFQLKVLVTLGSAQFTMYSLLYRDTNGRVSTRLRYFDTP